jgi:hypothetical protein
MSLLRAILQFDATNQLISFDFDLAMRNTADVTVAHRSLIAVHIGCADENLFVAFYDSYGRYLNLLISSLV